MINLEPQEVNKDGKLLSNAAWRFHCATYTI
jgi:hypothetical protein